MSPPNAGYTSPIPAISGWIDRFKVRLEEVIKITDLLALLEVVLIDPIHISFGDGCLWW